MGRTAVIILHYKNEVDTKECLASVVSNYPEKEQPRIILVVNLTNKLFCSFLKRTYPRIELIEISENSGFAKGNNLGIIKALELGNEFLILLNNDTLVSPGLFGELVRYAENNPSTGLISPKIYFAPGFEYHKDKYNQKDKGKVFWYAGGLIDWSNIYASHRGVDEVDKGQFENITETDFATGCCMLITRKLIEKIGLLDKKYYLYFEDVDYSIRSKKAGFKVVYYPKAYLWHKNASSSDKPGSPIHIYYQTRNRLYFGYKYSSFWIKKSLFVDSLRILFRDNMYTKGVIDYYLGRMGRGSI
ncbi:glycosyltransferase family 2 protein [Candidatus Gottesmanbacteria bacterium]|nr:glycosyltransferase family 2 protein [Candidatus Gottesmanbacteria bacterium]